MHIPFRWELLAGARLDFPGIVVKMEGVWEPIRESGVFIRNAGVDAPQGLGTPADSAVTFVIAFEAGGRTLPRQDPESALPVGVPRRRPILEPRRSQRREHRQKGR